VRASYTAVALEGNQVADHLLRVMWLIFVLETRNTVFYSLPSRFNLAELKADLPSLESIYSAKTVDDACEAAFKKMEFRVPQLDEILAMLFSNGRNESMRQRMEGMEIFSHFIIIAGNASMNARARM
jgi:hypothetical protein